MGNWVIVAIPEENDPVWKVSSERIPHLTLMFLGEQDENPELESRVADFLEHVASTSLNRFGLSVDRRGELGDKKADVVFFERRFIKDLENIQSYLLANRDIYEMYYSTEQYPEWTPHLTLGYPETPAHPDEREYPGITWVRFDRLALWTGDYQGTDVPLGNSDDTVYDQVSMDSLEGGVGMAAGTVQSVFDSMSETQKDAAARLFGAIAEDDDAVGANAVGNVARAVRGNARVSKSYEKAKVGRLLLDHQSAGTDKTHKILKRNGSVRVRHDDLTSEDEFMVGFLKNVTDFAHAIVEGLDSKKDGPPKAGGGKGDFDESKVKRDGRGRFSRQDQKWLEGRKDLELKLGTQVLSEMMPHYRSMAKKYGTTISDLNQNDMSAQDRDYLDRKVLEIANKVTARDGVSPSGEYRLAPKLVDNSIESKIILTKKGRELRQSDFDENEEVLMDGEDAPKDSSTEGDSLEHFGIKGMRWGIRRKVNPSTGLVEKGVSAIDRRVVDEDGNTVTMTVYRSKKTGDIHEINEDGSVGRVLAKKDEINSDGSVTPPEFRNSQKSADFDRAAKAYAKAEEKGLQSLSNEEIKAITNRVQTEKAFRALSEPQKSKLEQEVAQLRLEKEYKQLKSELNQKKASVGRKIINAFVEGAVTTAKGAAQKQGQDLIKEMLSQTGAKSATKTATKAAKTQFKVNPSKVKITRPAGGVGVR